MFVFCFKLDTRVDILAPTYFHSSDFPDVCYGSGYGVSICE